MAFSTSLAVHFRVSTAYGEVTVWRSQEWFTWATERLPKLVKGVCRSVRVPEAGSTTAKLPPALAGSEYSTSNLYAGSSEDRKGLNQIAKLWTMSRPCCSGRFALYTRLAEAMSELAESDDVYHNDWALLDACIKLCLSS